MKEDGCCVSKCMYNILGIDQEGKKDVLGFYLAERDNMPPSDPIHKATIIPRGRALGLVMRLPETDRVSLTREKMLADITVAMGGRVAEELIFGYDKVTSGASSDIKLASIMHPFV